MLLCCCWCYSRRCYATASTVDLKLAVVLSHDAKLQQHFLPVRRASKNWLAWKLASLARNTTRLFPPRVACRSMSWLSSVLYEAVSAQFPLYVQRTKLGLLRKSSLPLAVLGMRIWDWERRRSSTPVSILSIGIVMGFHCSSLAVLQTIRLTSLPGKWQQQLAATFSSSLWPTYVCHATLWLPFGCGPVYSVLAAILIALFYCCNEVVALTICNAVGKFVNCTESKPGVLSALLCSLLRNWRQMNNKSAVESLITK